MLYRDIKRRFKKTRTTSIRRPVRGMTRSPRRIYESEFNLDWNRDVERVVRAVEREFARAGYTGVSSMISNIGEFEEDEIAAAITVDHVTDASHFDAYLNLSDLALKAINSVSWDAPFDVDIDYYDTVDDDSENGVLLYFYF